MKALLYSDWEKIEIAEVPRPAPAANEILIRVEACGICSSELECFRTRSPRRRPPLILGHEITGIVAEAGSAVAKFRPGDPVVVNSVIACGECFACRRGEGNLCNRRGLFGMTRPGGCAEYVTAPESVFFPRPANLLPVVAALAEPAANAVNAMRLLPDRRKRTVFVIGAGMIGLMVTQMAKAMTDARVAVAEVNTARLEMARVVGADRVVNPDKEDLIKAAVEFSGEDGVDYVVDAAGTPDTKALSLQMIRPNGAACWVGLIGDEMRLSSYALTLAQKAVTGSYNATRDGFAEAIELLHRGTVRWETIVTTHPLAEAAAAFRRMLSPASTDIKTVIIP